MTGYALGESAAPTRGSRPGLGKVSTQRSSARCDPITESYLGVAWTDAGNPTATAPAGDREGGLPSLRCAPASHRARAYLTAAAVGS